MHPGSFAFQGGVHRPVMIRTFHVNRFFPDFTKMGDVTGASGEIVLYTNCIAQKTFGETLTSWLRVNAVRPLVLHIDGVMVYNLQ